MIDPAYTARDLLDIAGEIGEIALTLKWVGRGLGNAYLEAADDATSRRTAWATLQQASADLALLIAELRPGIREAA